MAVYGYLSVWKYWEAGQLSKTVFFFPPPRGNFVVSNCSLVCSKLVCIIHKG